MEKRTEGAWVIHHTKKLNEVTSTSSFDDIQLAGKCGLFLSSLAASDEVSQLDSKKVSAIADATNINKKLELPVITETLKEAQLIDVSAKGTIEVIGITTSNVLSHTADIFNSSTTDNYQKAALELSNFTSDKPIKNNLLKEYISDGFKLEKKLADKLFGQAEQIGLIDYEEFDDEKIYFNGNLFKRNSIEKTSKLLSSLSSDEQRKITELEQMITKEGCVSLDRASQILGSALLSKLQSIAMYDFNEVSNSTHSKVFLTKPSSFAKFGNPFEDDALDMAKAFIASLIYGLQMSSAERGKIQDYSMLKNTLRKLLRGERVGPCTAIGQDYQVLELNRVIKLEKGFGSTYYMRLLKYDIATLALDVIEKGDIAEQSTLETITKSSSVSSYSGPEENRWNMRRKKQTKGSDVGELLRTMRS